MNTADPIATFTMGFLALLFGALGVLYAKRMEVGPRSRPRSSPHPLCGFVRLAAAIVFFAGLFLIGAAAWFLLTHAAGQR